jgi:glycosyltransferase involved in cell wall biosynthesis
MDKKPLVSVLIPNYNHEKFLRFSIESAFSQTYKNIEVIFSDNCSTDDSIKIAMEYLDRGLIINKRPLNTWFYYDTAFAFCRGKYFMVLCADDCIRPDFINTAVTVMEEYNTVGFVQGERDYITENGEIIELDYFFNQSFMCPGIEMLPIYVLTDVGMAVQTLIRRESFVNAGQYDTDADYSCIDRELWFRLAMVSDYAYIREKTSLYRVHKNSNMELYTGNMFTAVAMYNVVRSMFEWAEIRGYSKVLKRREEAYKKLSEIFYQHINSCLKANNITLAKAYILFIKILDKNAENSITLKKYEEICNSGIYTLDASILPEDNSFRFHTRNYDPPEHAVAIDVIKGECRG